MAVTTQVEPIIDAVHLCTDMQNIFARGHIWETPWMERVLPRIVEIAARYPARTVFTRFITPVHADDRPGRWRRYFRQMAPRHPRRASRLRTGARSGPSAVCPSSRNHRQACLFGL
jgi:nicotinamidase-related amidase